jgi:hypothetical protein
MVGLLRLGVIAPDLGDPLVELRQDGAVLVGEPGVAVGVELCDQLLGALPLLFVDEISRSTPPSPT